jgi:hypothetical protein
MAYPRTGVPNTQATVFYSHVILVNGIDIGIVQKVAISQTRTAERIREIHASRGPAVREIVWCGTDTTVTLDRVELYTIPLLTALGLTNIYNLDDVNFTFDILEQQIAPDSGASGNELTIGSTRSVYYKKCVPTSLSKTIDLGAVKIVETMECYVTSIEVTTT